MQCSRRESMRQKGCVAQVWQAGSRMAATKLRAERSIPSEERGGAAALKRAQPRPAALSLAGPHRLAMRQQAGAVAIIRLLVLRPGALLGAHRGAVLAPAPVVERQCQGWLRAVLHVLPQAKLQAAVPLLQYI